jgi:hypothetical protein
MKKLPQVRNGLKGQKLQAQGLQLLPLQGVSSVVVKP